MADFQQCSLWKRTLAPVCDENEKQREFLRNEFFNFRDKAAILANEIARILPDYTVHSIEHIDALWETADLIVPKDYEINPSEAFVLGGAFLLHDLGMALAAYPKGIEELKTETIWIDAVHSCRKDTFAAPHGKMSEAEIEKYATEKTLRLLHAKRAKELAFTSWKDSNGNDVFLISNEEIRNSFGHAMGLLAYSHWCKVTELEEKLPPSLGALSRFPSSWTIDPIKLACILRIADAMQIDDRRAPSFLRILRNPTYSSDLHWCFQEKLFQPRLEQNRVVYTSKTPFALSDMEAWWTCFDTLKTIDYELREVDALLVSKKMQPLNGIGVQSIEDTKRLSRLIATDGWQPVDTKIKVSNVAKLASNIGGTQLYGNDMTVPLRELIQNASDAIRARRINDNEKEEYGDVIVRIGKDSDGHYIEVEDNGTGMSKDVLTGPFLDFGQSYWGSDLMHEEWPGLESKGFNSTGHYGIGFFSLFMWGQKIRVTTNRYDKSRADTCILEFNDGTYSRPVLRNANVSEYLRNGGTKVRVWVEEKVIEALLKKDMLLDKSKIIFARLLEEMCPAMDCNVIIETGGKSQTIIKANDWISMSSAKLIKRLIGTVLYKAVAIKDSDFLQAVQANMEVIKGDNGEIVGRAALIQPWRHYDELGSLDGVVTVGGFRTSGLAGLFGVFSGRSIRASRDVGIPLVSKDSLSKWAESQTKKAMSNITEGESQKEMAYVLRAFQIDVGGLKIAKHEQGHMNYNDIKNYVARENNDEYTLVDFNEINSNERINYCRISLEKNVFITESCIPGILQTVFIPSRNFDLKDDWLLTSRVDASRFEDRTLAGTVIKAISEGWGCSVDTVYKSSSLFGNDDNLPARIGSADGKEVVLDHVCIVRKPK